MSTDEHGVFVASDSGQKIVFHQDQAFMVWHDPDSGNWWLVKPRGDTKTGPRISRNAAGEWQIDNDARRRPAGSNADAIVQPASAADASNTTLTPADRLAEYMLQFPGYRADEVANALGVTREQTAGIQSTVQAAIHAWYEVKQATLQIRPTVIVDPLSANERQYVRKWSPTLSSASLAKIMRAPVETIDAFLGASARAVHPLPLAAPTKRANTNRAASEWHNTIKADIADGLYTSRMPVSVRDAGAAFMRQWRDRLSKSNVATIMTLPDAALARHLRLAGQARTGRPPPRRSTQLLAGLPAPAHQDLSGAGRQAEPQAGPSGHQGPMTGTQQRQVMELSSRGASPATIAMYIGKPRVMVEAFLLERPG
ncbi:hypothetical protein [Paraburkholderia rhizosphaerae]|uniref:hypothetical protein n=1 Tax=Paraburkholderia rhizosphaerae TaxID=480658 RepID=UPI001066C0B7|nr:hypothetical protein [Paraburkholderia rhizosphaerae]